MSKLLALPFRLALAWTTLSLAQAAERPDFSPHPNDKQLPRAMHTAMKERPLLTVGQKDAALLGTDNRVLQAAVDYVAALGGGTVVIGPGEFLMRDSLHLRSFVTVRNARADGSPEGQSRRLEAGLGWRFWRRTNHPGAT